MGVEASTGQFVENHITPFSENKPQLSESLFSYYDPEADVAVVRASFQSLHNPEENERNMAFYLHENLVHFLNEYAGMVPYSQISFLFTPSTVTYAGLDVLDQLDRTAAATHKDSREQAEYDGMRSIHRALRSTATSQERTSPPVGVTFSPAYIGDYGFVYIFFPEITRMGDVVVRERIIRYEEQSGTVATSAHLMQQITGKEPHQTAQEFLRNPIFLDASPAEITEKILDLVQIDTESLLRSRAFESQVRKELEPLFRRYCDIVISLSTVLPEDPAYQSGIESLKDIITACYLHAQQFTTEFQNSEIIQSAHSQTPDEYADFLMYQYAQLPAQIVGGGSCPVVPIHKKNTTSAGLLDTVIVWDTALRLYPSIDRLIHEQSVSCAICHKSTRDNHYHCPGRKTENSEPCHMRFADETHKSPEKRTKECPKCGFRFSC